MAATLCCLHGLEAFYEDVNLAVNCVQSPLLEILPHPEASANRKLQGGRDACLIFIFLGICENEVIILASVCVRVCVRDIGLLKRAQAHELHTLHLLIFLFLPK